MIQYRAVIEVLVIALMVPISCGGSQVGHSQVTASPSPGLASPELSPKSNAAGSASPDMPLPSPPIATPTSRPYFLCAAAGDCPPVAGIAAAFDPIRNDIVTFGGVDYPSNNLQIRDTTWRYKGGQWSQLRPAHVPPSRDTAVFLFDAARGVVVMYGGHDVPPAATAGTGGEAGKITFAADTWTWDGSDWTEQHPAHHPVLFQPDATYDFARNQIVLLGEDANGMATWTYDGFDWTQHSGVKPDPLRIGGLLSFDPGTKTVVDFGGVNQSAADLSAVWEWDGLAWTRTTSTGPKTLRLGPFMAPDPDRASMLLYDSDGTGAQASTWRWDGSAFQQLQPSHAPAVPALGLTSDPTRHRLLLFGQTWPERTLQVWSWSGDDWSLVTI